ncbi:hypothetical protein [Streptomyces sp. NRRL S-646]|uniref:hypothetical protein n=1 Tax=Streptomyces sp. NRRL S-646 TaxID=1463917 RepID=UPI0004CA0681|nr:hypothetical protein [Streptomyces sp. NRRL S-646]
MLITTAVAVVAPLAIPASLSAASAASSAEPAQQPSQAQLQQLDRVARSHSALGVFGDPEKGHPILMLPAGTSAAQKAEVKKELPAGLLVTVKISKVTKAEVDSVFKTIKAGKWNKDARKYGVGYTYDGEKDKVVVNLEGPKSAAPSLKVLKPDAIEVQPGRFTPENNRFNDYNPFYGGGAIKKDGSRSEYDCTAGFAIRHKPDGEKRMVTAAHCFYWNDKIKTADGKDYGNVTSVHQWLDTEAITGKNYTGRIYTGGYKESDSTLWVSDYSNWFYWGRQFCVSGASTYNHCGHPVSYSTYGSCYIWHGATYCVDPADQFLIDRGGNNGCGCGKFTAPGDSGAPVFEPGYRGDDAIIGGMHRGAVWNYNGQDRMLNVKVNSILNSANAEIVKGDS